MVFRIIFCKIRNGWREASVPGRALFILLLVLFIARASYYPRVQGDRRGFMLIGRAVLAGEIYENANINTYPPAFSVVMAPIVKMADLLGDRAIRYSWGLLQLFCLLLATHWFLLAFGAKPKLGAIAVAWLCVARYFVGDFNNQNVTLFLTALLAFGIYSFSRRKELTGSLAIGLAAAIKIWPGFMVAALLAARRWRGTIYTVLACLAVNTATIAILGISRSRRAIEFWFQKVLPSAGDLSLLDQSLRATFCRVVTSLIPNVLEQHSVLVRTMPRILGGAFFLCVLTLLVCRRPCSKRLLAIDALLMTYSGIVILPFVWFHYYSVLLGVVIAICHSIHELSSGKRRAIIALVVLGTILGEVFDSDIVGRRAWELAATYGNAFVGSLLVFIAGVLLRFQWYEIDSRESRSVVVPESPP